MKNRVSALRATTAILVSLSFIGSNAVAAGTLPSELRLAQVEEQTPLEPVAEEDADATVTTEPAAEEETEATVTTEPAAEEETEAQETFQATEPVDEDDELVEEVTEQEIEEVTTSGEDVVIEEETTTNELEAQLEELRQQQTEFETRLDDEPVTITEDVITEETARAATEETVVHDDDDGEIWKYLGAAAAGAAVGALVPALGGRLVQNQGDRVIVERDGEFFVRKDENQLLLQPGARVQTEEFPGGITRTTVFRDDGSRVVTVRNDGGFVLRRVRITPDGREIVLIEQTPEEVYTFDSYRDLPGATAHRRTGIDYAGATREELREALSAQPTYETDRVFALQHVRDNEQVRTLVPAIDLPINFRTGSAAIPRPEIEELTMLGRMMEDLLEENPREIFLVEGHTDAVGSNLMNLSLSDRRAESVALALTEYFDIPPENLVVQGYGERYLKEQTEGPSEANRRATVRRITPLIDRVASR